MAPHVICTKWKKGSSAEAIPNSTHSPISHLPLSLKEQEQGRTRERMEIRDEGGRWSEDMQSKIIVIEPSNL
jgi:hypothetical protein